MARLTTASPKSPLRSRAPGGTVRASLASGIRTIDRQWGSGHEGSCGEAGSLRDLYPCLHRARARPGVQLAGRAIRGRLCLHQKLGDQVALITGIVVHKDRLIVRFKSDHADEASASHDE